MYEERRPKPESKVHRIRIYFARHLVSLGLAIFPEPCHLADTTLLVICETIINKINGRRDHLTEVELQERQRILLSFPEHGTMFLIIGAFLFFFATMLFAWLACTQFREAWRQ